MRNLLEHPATKDEIITCLRHCWENAQAEGAVGDMRPTLLHIALAIIEHTPEHLVQKHINNAMPKA